MRFSGTPDDSFLASSSASGIPARRDHALQLLPTPPALSADCLARDLTFEERLRAQERTEQVYYSHQIGVRRPFEETVPRPVLEEKVRTYLEESLALEKLWHSPITPSMLQAELERMAR